METGTGYFDMHCHILPGIDDGFQEVEDSVTGLQLDYEGGIDVVVATPHYYPKESVDSFLARRKDARDRLAAALTHSKKPFPAVYLGAEVAYREGLLQEEKLDKLCIAGSRYMLLELPFHKWSAKVITDVRAFYRVRGIIPILAHLERYFDIEDKEAIEEVRKADVLVQMNAEYILDKHTRKKAKKILSQGGAHVLGSDCHNLTSRPPNLDFAFEQMFDWGMDDLVYEMIQTSEHIINNGL